MTERKIQAQIFVFQMSIPGKPHEDVRDREQENGLHEAHTSSSQTTLAYCPLDSRGREANEQLSEGTINSRQWS